MMVFAIRIVVYAKQSPPPKIGQVEKDPTHSAMYGVQLVEVMNKAGLEAIVSYPTHDSDAYGSVEKFLIEKLKAK